MDRDSAGDLSRAAAARPSDRIAQYRILHKLGEGGMGLVYVAEDERLDRKVALKLLRGDSPDPNARHRLIREARIAAGISHPLVCQVFELGEWNDQPFIAMELLEGEPLATRLGRGPLLPYEAVQLAATVVDALRVLHQHGIVHRDLKPSNIFITSSGVKVLDFGLARPFGVTEPVTAVAVTQAGAIVGTPQYAAPEQLLGEAVDARADLFSAAVILFEMLAGRPPFAGATLAALIHAVLYETPPVLTGSAAISAIDRVVHRALAKRPEDRHPTADALAADLRSILPLVTSDRVTEARPMVRLAVLPFRLLKPDHEIDYLSLSLADALASSLSGFESLIVRSTLKSMRYEKVLPDLSVLATELAVDMVLTGSILRLNDRLRVGAELVSAPAGDVLWSQTTQVPLDQVFELHDQLSQRVIASLPLTARDHAREPAVRPQSAKAFDLYLRGMQLRMETSSWRQARSFFERCLELDPAFAPAWAERGRLDRTLGKYEDRTQLAHAESAFRHALELDPENGAALHHWAQLEMDLGRVETALRRLLGRARQGRAEPQIYAALVQACRYAGLLDESVVADHQARRLEPTLTTSVPHTYYMQGDYVRALEESHRSSDPFESRVLGAMGRDAEAVAAARREEQRFATIPLMRNFSTGLRAAFEGRQDEALTALQSFDAFAFSDGEGLFYIAEIYARLARLDQAYSTLDLAVATGFLCLPAFEHDPYLKPLREDARWPGLLDRVRSKQQSVIEAFGRAGGRTLLGV